MFRECSLYSEIVTNPAQTPEVLHRAMRVLVGRRGVAIIVIPEDVAIAAAPDHADGSWPKLNDPLLLPSIDDVERMAALLLCAARSIWNGTPPSMWE